MLPKCLSWNRDVEEQDPARGPEVDYPAQWTRKRIKHVLLSLLDNTLWNVFICFVVLAAFIMSFMHIKFAYMKILNNAYDVIYAVHVFNVIYYTFRNWDNTGLDWWRVCMILLDITTFTPTYTSSGLDDDVERQCTCSFRLHTPFLYLWHLNDYHMNCSVVGTALKYCYMFIVLRIFCASLWFGLDLLEQTHIYDRRALILVKPQQLLEMEGFEKEFFYAFYVINKMFIPIGPSVAPTTDVERVLCLVVMIMGGLVVTGAAVASLSLVFSIYMRPEETFRARYLLIIKEMTESSIPPSLRAKVETFYTMYWHKQRAVSATQLLPIFPPSLPATIYMDIYFKATQKCRILRDLSYQFLTEVAKKMETIHFIPGDSIIKRSTKKSSIIYMAYGDIELS